MIWISSIFAILMTVFVTFIRLRAAKKPTSTARIILPPIFMSTGFAMFLLPEMQVPLLHAIEALIVGMLLSYPLIATSKFEIKGNEIYLKRSKSFIFILIALVIFRLILKTFVGEHVSMLETSGLFYLLAFGMIFPWRIAMLVHYRRLQKHLRPGEH
ncbi:CcdC family protein [Bacillaceae bacterium]